MKTTVQKFITSVNNILNWSAKNLSKIKTATVLLLLILFLISFINNGCNRDYANRLVKQIIGLDIQNDILNIRNRTLEDSLFKEKTLRLQLEHLRAILLSEKEALSKDNKRLKEKIAGIPGWLLNMPADSSYKFLNEIAYPFVGEKKYPFSDPQVKNIHADFLENTLLTSLVIKLEDQLVNCEKIGDNSDSLKVSFMKSFSIAEEKSFNSEQKAKNLEQKASIFEKESSKCEKRKTFWRSVSGVLVVLVAVLVI